MVSVMLELNRQCNLLCSYCYLNNENERMTYDVAIKSIQYVIHKINSENHKCRQVAVYFTGGEPLLSFWFLQEVVKYCVYESQKQNIKFTYSITTNATLLNEEIIEYLIKNRFRLNISLDGRKEVNDLNRQKKNGMGSYLEVIDKMELIKDFESKMKRSVQVSHVLTHNNVEKYFDSIIHLTKDLGFLDIDTSFNNEEEWTQEDLLILKENLQKIFDYFCESYEQNKFFIWRFLKAAFENYKSSSNLQLFNCGAGVISFYINYYGNIYLCSTLMQDKYNLGNVDNGLKVTPMRDFISKAKDFKELKCSQCDSCDFNEFCSAKGCYASSIKEHNSINQPANLSCNISKIRYHLIESNLLRIDEIFKNFKIVNQR